MRLVPNHLGIKNSYRYTNEGLTTLVDEAGKSLFDTTHVKGSVFISRNKLTSLKGCPKHVQIDFSVAMNPLTSLEGGPEIVGDDYVVSGTHITSFEGAPTKVGGNVYAEGIETMTSLKGINKHLGRARGLHLKNTPIKSHILGIFKIASLNSVWLDDVKLTKLCNDILTHLNREDPDRTSNASLLDAQEQLIDAGYDDFALL